MKCDLFWVITFLVEIHLKKRQFWSKFEHFTILPPDVESDIGDVEASQERFLQAQAVKFSFRSIQYGSVLFRSVQFGASLRDSWRYGKCVI